VVAAFCKQVHAGGRMVVHGDGSQTRDFIYVDDLCRGISQAMTSGVAGVVAHLGSGVETTVMEVAREVAARFGAEFDPELRPPRQGDIERTYADISYAREAFGFAPGTHLDTGLDRTVQWFQEHM
jgi:UDP-glucose 4-epimerase